MAETIKTLLIAVERRGMTIFARIAAEKTGLRLRSAELFVPGYPEAEAPLIAEVLLFALDFHRRVLVWEDEHGGAWTSYNGPLWLGRRHNINPDIIPKFDAIGASLAGIAAEATIRVMVRERDVARRAPILLA